MKNKCSLLFFFAICLWTMACKKDMNNNTPSVNNLFNERLNNILLTEPLLVSFNNGTNATIVNWKVLPDNNYTISKVGIYATLQFSKAGVYNIIAQANDAQATYIVTVADSMYSDGDTSFSLQASKWINVLPKETIAFTVNHPTANNFIWKTVGNLNNFNTAGNPAFFSFTGGRTGTVKVTVGNKTVSRTIWLKDSTINNPLIDTVGFIFSDKIIITPSVEKDSNGNKKLVLTAKTTYNYQSNTDAIVSLVDSSNNEYTLNYGGVVMAAKPSASVNSASCTNSIINMSVGVHVFTVNIGNKTYTGTITLDNSGSYRFAWATNKEVTIYPLVVQ